jgi:hypothetical protein
MVFNDLYCSHNYSSELNKNEMGGACGTYVRQERCIQDFGGEKWRKETTEKT